MSAEDVDAQHCRPCGALVRPIGPGRTWLDQDGEGRCTGGDAPGRLHLVVIEPVNARMHGDVHECGPTMCGYCIAPVTMRSFNVGTRERPVWMMQPDPHRRPHTADLCHEVEEARRLQAGLDAVRVEASVRTARWLVDRLAILIEGPDGRAWPCCCPDSFLQHHIPVPDCPRHTLGPALIAEMTALHRPTLTNTSTGHDCPVPDGQEPGKEWACTCGARYVLGFDPLRRPGVNPLDLDGPVAP